MITVLHHGDIHPAHKAPINGASGGVVTLRSLGADHVVDYKRNDFVRSGKRYEVPAAIRYLEEGHARRKAAVGVA